jgi:type II secretory pathway pseudopilin PulG
MKKLAGRLKSQRGETLLEALVAILVIVFSGLTLYYSAITSARINAAASKADELFRAETSAAEQQGGVNSAGEVTITSADGFMASVDVDYTGLDGQLTSYRMNGG